MTTLEHVIELLRQLDDVELEDLKRNLIGVLGENAEPPTARHDALGAFVGMDDGIIDKGRTYDPLGKIIDLVGDEYEGPTDVLANKYRHLADAIQHC